MKKLTMKKKVSNHTTYSCHRASINKESSPTTARRGTTRIESDKREREPQEDAMDEEGDAARRCQRRDGNREGVTDEEVEEFFAILRRWSEASRYAAARAEGKAAKKRKKNEREEAVGPSWRPRFELEDFAGVAGIGDGDGIASAAADEGREGRCCGRTVRGATELEIDLNEQPHDTY